MKKLFATMGLLASLFLALGTPTFAEELTPQLLCERSPLKGTFGSNKIDAKITVAFKCKKKLSAWLESEVTRSNIPTVNVGSKVSVQLLFIEIAGKTLQFYNPQLQAKYVMEWENDKLSGTATSPTNSGGIVLVPEN